MSKDGFEGVSEGGRAGERVPWAERWTIEGNSLIWGFGGGRTGLPLRPPTGLPGEEESAGVDRGGVVMSTTPVG